MLGLTPPLYFPKLIPLGDVVLDHPSTPERILPSYRLAWGAMERKLERKHREWVTAHWPNQEGRLAWVKALPDGWNWVDDQIFVVTSAYLNEIRRMSHGAVAEWNQPRPFDTCVREACLNPAIYLIRTALYLLSDCAYDLSTQYFGRTPRHQALRYILAYRFWFHQTGSGCIAKHAGLNDFEDIAHGPAGDTVFGNEGRAILNMISSRIQLLQSPTVGAL